MQLQLDARYKEIEAYVIEASTAEVPERIQSYLFRFGAVLICGNVERSIEIIILERLTNRAQPRVLSFVKSHFQRGTNFDCNAVEQLLQRFDPQWYRAFVDFVECNPRIKEGISSCYAVRNSVAHGGTMSIGKNRLKELLELSRAYINAIVDCIR